MKQVILMRKDLKMRRGKEIAQGSHASMAFLLRATLPLTNQKVVNWMNTGQTKICLQINSEEELLELHKKAQAAGLISHYIVDAGRTEFKGIPTKTCLAIGPDDSDKIDAITGHLNLY